MAGEHQGSGPPGALLPAQDDATAPAGAAPLARGTLAVFDLDRTLLPGSSLLALAAALVSSGMVSRRRIVTAAVQERRCRRRGSDDEQVDRLRDEALRHVAGLDREPMVDLARTVAHRLAAAVHPGARHLVVGTRAEVVDGRYTGRLDGPFCYGPGKIDRLVADPGPHRHTSATAPSSNLPRNRSQQGAISRQVRRRCPADAVRPS